MKEFVYGVLFVFLAFLPFYMLSSPKAQSVSMRSSDPASFELKQGKEGGTLYFILNGDPKTLNPVLAQETTSTAVISDVFSGLTKINLKTMEYEPDLAESIEILDGGKRYVIRLKRNVKWNDGVDFSAMDVVFTYKDIYLNKNIPNSTADMLSGVLKDEKDVENFVRLIDKYTVEFNLSKPFAPFLGILSAPILPKHKLEKFVKEGTFMQAWNVNTKPEEIVGTGPYRIKRYLKGQLVEYDVNPYYYEKDPEGKTVPYIKERIGYIVQDPDTALLMFSTKKVDYIGVRPADLLTLSKLSNTVLFDLGPTPSTTFLVFNQNPQADIPKHKLEWFKNREFRRAISMAIDRFGISMLVYNGLAQPLYGPITPANKPYYMEGLFPEIPYDLKKAREILESIGFKDRNKDGWLEDKDGNILEIILLTNAGNKEREAIGNMIKQDLESIGIRVLFRSIDFNALVQRLTAPPYQWEAVIIGLTGSLDPHFGRNVWHSSGTLHMWNPRQKSPATDWEKKVDELFDLASSTIDSEKRVELYREAYKIIAQEQPLIFLATPKSMLSVRNKFENFFPTVWGQYKEEYMFFR
ncbi:ABC transporter substrate-binding protein [Thermocrinis sp.]|uniref:ABC transporter substrate-binding protein n=1 Tax=Thermocrinis sp. TaxID=2024383 RepID=UPI002FDCEE27